MAELRAVLAAVRERQPGCAIYLLGRSLGGAASIVTASQEPQLERLILWATPNILTKDSNTPMTTSLPLSLNERAVVVQMRGI